MSFLPKIFGFGAPATARPQVPEIRATLAVAAFGGSPPKPVTIYPPVDTGLPAVSPEEILQGASAKIKRLAEIAGGTASDFDRLYLVPLRNLAEQVHMLPATAHAHYSAPAGLFNMCLDVALLARQSAEGKIFVPEATIEIRHKTEGAWRYSAFLAGLLSQLHVPVGSMTVTAPDGSQWPRYGTSIYDWLLKNGHAKYYVTWHEKAKVTGAEGASLLSTVVPADVMDWLAKTDSQIIRDVTIAVTREMSSAESILGAILKSVVTRVKDVDAIQHPARFGRLTIGTQFEPHLLNAMRELLEDGTWKCNEGEGPLFWGSDGMYIAWPVGLKDVLTVFEKRGLSAMPHSSVTLAEMLGLCGVIISKETGVWVHDIVVADKSGDQIVVSAMRFKDPLVLIGHLPLKPLTKPFGKMLVDAQREQLALAGANHLAAAPSSAKSLGATGGPVQSAPAGNNQNPASELEPKAPTAASAPDSLAAAPKSDVDAQKPNAPLPAVLAHVEELSPGERLPVEVLTKLRLKPTDSAAGALGMALEQAQQYRTDRVRRLDWGVAICTTWLTEVAAFSIADLATPLNSAGVIAKDPAGRSLALVSQVVFSDSEKPRTAIVLKLDFAARVGMPIDAKA